MMRSMHVRDSDCDIAFFLQDIDGGGAERAIIKLAGEIAELGYKVDLVVGDADSDYRAEVSHKVNLIYFATRSPFAVLIGLASYLRSRKPAVIMSALDPANIMLIIAARIIGYKGKTVISQRAVLDASLRGLNRGRRMITWLLMRFFFPRADALISNSHAAAVELQERLTIPASKLFIIPNAIDVARIKQLALEPLNATFINENSGPLIVSVGSLTIRKDMETLIKAFARVTLQRQASLIIVGKGPEQPRLESLIATLGLSGYVHMPGFDANPYKWIAAASVFVSSSTEEGFPNVIAESLALGCPVVATDCPGDSALLMEHGKWGRLVPVGEPERMAEAILATLDDSNRPDGKVRAADFSPIRNTSAYLNVLLSKKVQNSSAS